MGSADLGRSCTLAARNSGMSNPGLWQLQQLPLRSVGSIYSQIRMVNAFCVWCGGPLTAEAPPSGRQLSLRLAHCLRVVIVNAHQHPIASKQAPHE